MQVPVGGKTPLKSLLTDFPVLTINSGCSLEMRSTEHSPPCFHRERTLLCSVLCDFSDGMLSRLCVIDVFLSHGSFGICEVHGAVN